MRRLTIAGLALAVSGILLGLASPALAQGDGAGEPLQPGVRPAVVVLKVDGILDPVVADFVERSIASAADSGALAVVLQVNSSRSVLDEARFRRLADAVRTAPLPVTSWVGPSGARATGPVAQLVALTSDVGISPGSRIGDLGRILVPGADFGDAFPALRHATVGYDEAPELGVARQAPIIGEFLIDLEGFETRIDDTGEVPRRVPVTPVVFRELPLGSQLMHTVASPPVAYLLFLVGMGLLVFEMFTAGIGLAGAVGAGSLVLGSYGLDVLPARWWAVALLILAMFGFAVDVQVGVPRFWTGVGVVALVAGSLWLYDGTPMSWITQLVGIVGVCLGMVWGMPAMVRTRFSTPTIGREWMVGELGVAETAVSPDGVVRVHDALWRARTNRATPIEAGQRVRVVEIDHLLLEVEPEEGGARDYRERARSRRGGDRGATDAGGEDDGEVS